MSLKTKWPTGWLQQPSRQLIPMGFALRITPNRKQEVFLTNLIRYLDQTFRNNAMVGPLGDHFVIDLKGNLTLVVLLFGEYEWSILFNNTLCTLGLFRNVIMPGVISTFNDKHIPGNP